MEFVFEPKPLWQVAAGAAAVAAAAAVVGAARVSRLVGGGRAAALCALRVGALAALLLWVLAPRQVYYATASAAPPVAILVDSSASMDLETEEGSRLARALAAAREVGDAVERAGGEYRLYDFAADSRPWGADVPTGEAVRAPETRRSRSDAARALRRLASYSGREGLAAAVVLSDGGWEALPALEELPPCFTLAPAAAPPPASVHLSAVTLPALVLPGTAFDVRASYYSTREAGAEARVEVAEEGAEGVEYAFRPAAGRGELVASVVATEPGPHFYRLRVAPGGGDRWFHVRVLERPLRVWYHEMAGDADFAFFKRALTSHRGFDVEFRLDLAEGGVGSVGGPPADVDVAVLGNPRPGALSAAEAEALERHVASGGGLLIIASARPAAARALAEGALGRLAPVHARAAGEVRGGALREAAFPGAPGLAVSPPRLTHAWDLGPPKASTTPVWLAADGTPAFVVMPYGLGRVGLLAGGGLFEWHLLAPGDGGLLRLAPALILALYGERREDVAVSRPLAAPGEAVEVTCRAVTEPTVVAAGPAGEVFRLGLRRAAEDLWVGRFAAEHEGRYEVTARLPAAGGVRVERAAVRVVAPTAEYEAFFPRPERLRALAEATGGRHFAPGEQDRLAEAVAGRVAAAPAIREPKRRQVWPPVAAFATALLLLAADWYWRRRLGLA
jgi:hypothetical protein